MTSLKEIAKLANVSIGTVDRAIHNRGRINQEKKDLILKIIEEHNFKPNIHARNLKLSKTYKIGILIPGYLREGEYWSLVYKGINFAFESLKAQGITIKYFHYDRYKTDSLVSAAPQAMEYAPDGLIIAPDDSSKALEFIRSIPKGIPYVFLDTPLDNVKPITCIAQNGFQGGYTAARLMDLVLKERQKTIAILIFVSKRQLLQQRITGFQSYFEKYPEIQVKPLFINKDTNNTIQETLSKTLDQLIDNIGGIFVADSSAHYVAAYLDTKQLPQRIPLVGYDVDINNISHVNNGTIDFLISQQPEMQGKLAFNSLYRNIVLRESVEPNINIPIDIIMKENIDFHY